MRNCLGRSGGCRRDRRARLRYPRCRKVQRAWLRCRWAAGPGRTTSRRAEPPIIDPAPLVWRAPEGSAAVPVGGGRASTKQKSHIISYGHFWRPPRNVAIATTLLHDLKYPQGNYVRNWRGGIAERQGLAAVPVGGGGAWPGFETTRRAKLAARTARGRAAAHRHTQRPSPPAPRTPVGHQATKQPRNGNARQPQRAAARSRSQWNTQRSRAATTSATWTALRAAPLRRLSPETTKTRPRLPSTA